MAVTEQADRESLRDGRRRQTVLDVKDGGDVAHERRHGGDHRGGHADAEHAARDAEQQHLRHVDRENFP